MDKENKPGSPDAVKQGCTCPILDNGHGRGRGGDGKRWGWYVNENCPIHAARERQGE